MSLFLPSSVLNVPDNCCLTVGHPLLSVLNFKALFISLLQFKLNKGYVQFTHELEKSRHIYQNRGTEEERYLPDQLDEIAVVKIGSTYGLFSFLIRKKPQHIEVHIYIKHQRVNNSPNSTDFISKRKVDRINK